MSLIHLLVHLLSLVLLSLLHRRPLLLVIGGLLVLGVVLLIIHGLELLSLVLALRPHLLLLLLLLHHVLRLPGHLSLVWVVGHLRNGQVPLLDLLLVSLLLLQHSLVGILLRIRILVGGLLDHLALRLGSQSCDFLVVHSLHETLALVSGVVTRVYRDGQLHFRGYNQIVAILHSHFGETLGFPSDWLLTLDVDIHLLIFNEFA